MFPFISSMIFPVPVNQPSLLVTPHLIKSERLDNADLVGNVQSVVIRGQDHVSLLLPIWPNQGVDLLAVNLVEGLDSILDVLLGSLEVNNKDLMRSQSQRAFAGVAVIIITRQGVVVLNLLHGALSGQGILEDSVAIKLLGGGSAGDGKGQLRWC
jgi:hypothetical protein